MSDSIMVLPDATCYTSGTETEIYFIMATNRETTLEKQIEKTKKALVALGDMRPGSLSKQYNVCGKPGCSCKADPPKKHGPYYQVSYTRKGKSSSKFVKKEDLPEARKQIKNYEKMKLLADRWIDLATELSNLRVAKEKAKITART